MSSIRHHLGTVLRSPSRSLSTKLSLGILLLAAPIFVISMGLLFTQSRHLIRTEAVGRATSVLNATMQRLNGTLNAIVTATNANSWLATECLQPDSLLALSNKVVRLNPHVDGCSISAEPDLFPEYGRYFSVYTIKERNAAGGRDSIISVIEEQYEYFDKEWYKTPRDLKVPCWVGYYDEADSLEVALDGKLASYGRPIYDHDGRFVAVISTDLSLLHLSQIVTSKEKPYPNSYFMMIDNEGYYYIHPDSTRLFTHTIFDGADPRQQADLIALGHEMTAGRQGSMAVAIDGVPGLVCYQPVPGTTWSLALVCPDSDVLKGYRRQNIIIVPLLIVGLIIIIVLCHRTVAHAIRPLNQLLTKTQSIAEGNMEIHIPQTQREDAVGRLQNSFATMLRSLQFHMGSVRYTADQARCRNEELLEATRLVEEADRQKTAFIQNVSHQIRTPLNIVMGFAQVISDTTNVVPLTEEELRNITGTMDHNSKLLYRMVLMLFDCSDVGLSEELSETAKHQMVACNSMARETISYILLRYPNLNIRFHTDVPDSFSVKTNPVYLMRTLREILYNSAKYSDGQHIDMSVTTTDTAVRFIVKDTGKGIAEADRESIFKFFTKIDDLSEGLGLGLPLAKRHACNLGGDLILDEDYHDGCCFIVELPLA